MMDAYNPDYWFGEWLKQQGGLVGFASDPFSQLNNSINNWRQRSDKGGTDVTYYSGYVNNNGEFVPGSRPGFSGGGGAGAADTGGAAPGGSPTYGGDTLAQLPQGTPTAGLGYSPEALGVSGAGLGGSSGAGLSTAGLGYSPEALGLSGAGLGGTGSGSMTISYPGSSPWMKYGKAAMSAYSAYQNAEENKRMREAAERGQSQTRSPYMEELLRPLIPYILQEALGVYGQRSQRGGRQAGPQDQLLALLAQYFGGNR